MRIAHPLICTRYPYVFMKVPKQHKLQSEPTQQAMLGWIVLAGAVARASAGWDAPLPAMLSIDWRRLPDLPQQGPLRQGFQDSDGGVVQGDTIVTAFGSVAACLWKSVLQFNLALLTTDYPLPSLHH